MNFNNSKFLENQSNSALASIYKCNLFEVNSKSNFESNLRSSFANSALTSMDNPDEPK